MHKNHLNDINTSLIVILKVMKSLNDEMTMFSLRYSYIIWSVMRDIYETRTVIDFIDKII